MIRIWLAVVGACLGAAQAGGAGPHPPTSRTVPVLIINFSPGPPISNLLASGTPISGEPFTCQDNQSVFAEVIPSGLRLTQRGEVFNLPKLAQPGGYGENGVSWVRTGPNTAELTLGRTQPLHCSLPASTEAIRAQFKFVSGQHYRCAADTEVLVTLLESGGQPLAFVHQRRGAQPWSSTLLLAQVRSASGTRYQNSAWTWFSQGRAGVLETQGKTVAQGCRLE